MTPLLLVLGILLQQGTVFGWVRAEGSLEPIAFASVDVGGRVILTDEHGYYVAPGVPAGEVRLRVAMLGYRTGEATLVVPPSGSIRADVLLTPAPVRLEENGAEGCNLGYYGFGQHFAFGGGNSATATADSMKITIPNIRCIGDLAPGRFDSIQAEARVQLWNADYEAYVDLVFGRGQSVREAEISAGLDGAWGVFGAITPSGVPVTILRDPPL